MGKGSEMVMEIGHDLQRSVARAVEQSEEVGVREGLRLMGDKTSIDRGRRARGVWRSGAVKGSGCEIRTIDADAGIRTCCVCFAFFAVDCCCCLLWLLLLLLSLLHLMAAIMASFTFCLEEKRLAWPRTPIPIGLHPLPSTQVSHFWLTHKAFAAAAAAVVVVVVVVIICIPCMH